MILFFLIVWSPDNRIFQWNAISLIRLTNCCVPRTQNSICSVPQETCKQNGGEKSLKQKWDQSECRIKGRTISEYLDHWEDFDRNLDHWEAV